MSKKLENKYKQELAKRIQAKFPKCEIHHLDPNEIQGTPDMLILGDNGRWATLEGKKSDKESYRPNQEYYIKKHNSMSYSSMVCPENEKEVMNDLEQVFRPRRKTRISKSK